MHEHLLTDELIRGVELQMERLGASCNPCAKSRRGAAWTDLRESVESFDAALTVAIAEGQGSVEVAVFLVHLKYGGIMIWSSLEPDVVNDFSTWT